MEGIVKTEALGIIGKLNRIRLADLGCTHWLIFLGKREIDLYDVQTGKHYIPRRVGIEIISILWFTGLLCGFAL